MNLTRNLNVVILTLAGFLYTGGEALAKDSGTKPQADTTQYLIELSEYELEQSVPIGLSEAEVVAFVRKSGIEPVETVETIRLTATPDSESMVQFGKRIHVATDTMTRGDTTTRRFEELDTGTILILKVAPAD